MVQVSYPGVYIQEVPSGVRTIAGVSTSIALFIGRTARGPLNKPVRCLSYSDFVRTFTADTRFGEMPHSVRLFFENGGTQCYALRIADGATHAAVKLKSESEAEVLTLTAKEAGVTGETIRAAVTYSGAQPEMTFNLELFRWEADARGEMVAQDREYWPNLSMDSASPRYVEDVLAQNSRLVEAAAAGSPAAGGYSQSGRPVPYDSDKPTTFREAWGELIGKNATDSKVNWFRINVKGGPFVDVDLSALDFSGLSATSLNDLKVAVGGAITEAINAALPAGETVAASFADGPTPVEAEGSDTALLHIECTDGDVVIEPYPDAAADLAVPLMLGTAQGGLEVSRYAAVRPAATGLTFEAQTALVGFAALLQDALSTVTLAEKGIDLNTKLQTVAADQPMYKDNYGSSKTGHNDGVREKLALIVKAVNDYVVDHPNFKWRAEVWGYRLALLPTGGGDNEIGTLSIPIKDESTGLDASFTTNVRYYSVGAAGTQGLQTPGTLASDGGAPGLSDYQAAYEVVKREVDLFNLLVLPADKCPEEGTAVGVWGPASAFCEKHRALLLMDAPASWTGSSSPVEPATDPNVTKLRVGLAKSYSALFYPRLIVNENGRQVQVGASGAIAGLMARTDSTRGVWKAPAGTEADLRGVVGLAQRFSDADNGLLNPRAINTIRAFPVGIVNWGARTMDGDDDFGSEWKYIPVRRLALYIEESLYRGTQWAVFEPNDEPLWSQLRLNIGAFMHNLFRQGAFRGTSPRDAYLVKCDRETTTQNDINLGIVNILVGFAPLKPAEFVVIKLQQKAGQVQA